MPFGIFGKISGPSALGRRRAGGGSFMDATGGDIEYLSSNNQYFKKHTFDDFGTSTLNVTAAGPADFVLVGAGSMGGRTSYGHYARNGGNGGGVVEQTNYSLAVANYNVVIGQGGGQGQGVSNKDGEDSTFDGNTAGGGVGSTEGESGYSDSPGHAGSPQNSFTGGTGRQWGSSNYNYGGGGAGAGGSGGNWTDSRGGDGGDGYLSTITGEYYGAGAQGALDQSSTSDPSDGQGWGNFGSGGTWNSDGYNGALILKYQVATPSNGRAEGNTSTDNSNSSYSNSTITGPFGSGDNAVKFNRPSGNYNINYADVALGKNWVNNSKFETQSNAFTIEFRVKWDNDNSRGIRLMTTNGNLGWNNAIQNNQIQLSAEDGNLELYVDGPTGGSWGNQSRTDNTWYAIAICSDGNGTVRGYLDGSLKKTWTNNNTGTSIGSTVSFGCGFITDSLVNGNYAAFDELRFSNIARYTGSSYTLATSAFTNDINTTGLYHLNDFNFTDDTA